MLSFVPTARSNTKRGRAQAARRSVSAPRESLEALAQVVALARLAEQGAVPVVSLEGMSDEALLALIKASTPSC